MSRSASSWNSKNPGGFFERVDINNSNDRLIESAGQTLALPGDPRDVAKNADLSALDPALLDWRSTSQYWGVKDPRLCASLLAWVESGFVDRNRLRIVHVRRKLEPTVRSGMLFDSIRAVCDGTEESSSRTTAS